MVLLVEEIWPESVIPEVVVLPSQESASLAFPDLQQASHEGEQT